MQSLSIVTTLVITLANMISKIVLAKFAAYQKKETYSKQIYREAFSMMSVEVLNAGTIPLIIAIILSIRDSTENEGGYMAVFYLLMGSEPRAWSKFITDAYMKNGLVEQITLVLLTMLFGDALKQLLKPQFIVEKRKRLCSLKKDKDGKISNMTQAELN